MEQYDSASSGTGLQRGKRVSIGALEANVVFIWMKTFLMTGKASSKRSRRARSKQLSLHNIVNGAFTVPFTDYILKEKVRDG